MTNRHTTTSLTLERNWVQDAWHWKVAGTYADPVPGAKPFFGSQKRAAMERMEQWRHQWGKLQSKTAVKQQQMELISTSFGSIGSIGPMSSQAEAGCWTCMETWRRPAATMIFVMQPPPPSQTCVILKERHHICDRKLEWKWWLTMQTMHDHCLQNLKWTSVVGETKPTTIWSCDCQEPIWNHLSSPQEQFGNIDTSWFEISSNDLRHPMLFRWSTELNVTDHSSGTKK